MITIAVQGQQASQMVEIQGAPQPAEGSGATFRDTFAATVGNVPGGKAPAEGTAQPGASALRPALGNNVAGSNGLAGKTTIGGESTKMLAEMSSLTSAASSSGEAASETLSAATGTAVPGTTEDAASTNAAASLKSALPAPGANGDSHDSIGVVPETLLGGAATTPGTAVTTSSTGKTTQPDRKAEAPSSKTTVASTAIQANPSQANVQTASVATISSDPILMQTAVPVQFDLGNRERPSEPEGPDAALLAGGIGSSGSAGTGSVGGTSPGAAATAKVVAPLSADPDSTTDDITVPLGSSAAAIVMASESAGSVSAAKLSERTSVAVADAKAASSGELTAASANQSVAATEAATSAAGAAAEPAQFAASIKSLTTSTPVSTASVPVSGTVVNPVELQSLKTASAAQIAGAARSNAAVNSVLSNKAGASTPNPFAAGVREQKSNQGATDVNAIQTGAGVPQAVVAAQTPGVSPAILPQSILSQSVQVADATRETAAAPVAKDTKTKQASDAVTALGGSTSASSQSADPAAGGISGDSVAVQKDSTGGAPASAVPTVVLPVGHSTAAPVASVGSGASGLAVPAVASSTTGAGTRPVGGLSGVSAGAGSLVTASTGATETGLSTDGGTGHRTLLATPTTLEVGVPNGTQGWLRIRAEVGGQGEVNASLAAGSSGAQDALHSQLPALNAYLHSEQMPVTATVEDRGFASFTGHAPSAGSGEANGSASSFFQGGAPQSDAGQRQSPQQALTSNDATRGYGGLAGQNQPGGIAAVSQLGAGVALSEESGQWLNVRV